MDEWEWKWMSGRGRGEEDGNELKNLQLGPPVDLPLYSSISSKSWMTFSVEHTLLSVLPAPCGSCHQCFLLSVGPVVHASCHEV